MSNEESMQDILSDIEAQDTWKDAGASEKGTIKVDRMDVFNIVNAYFLETVYEGTGQSFKDVDDYFDSLGDSYKRIFEGELLASMQRAAIHVVEAFGGVEVV